MANTNSGRTRLCRCLFLWLLMLVLIAGEGFAAVSGVKVGSFSEEKVNVYVRALVPGSNTPWRSVGHYDLMIEGVYTFKGKTFKNPVFSYRMEDSSLAVFNEADTGKFYAHKSRSDYYYDCDLYQCRYSVDTGDVKNLFKALNGSISSTTKYSGGVKCRFKSSSAFSKYKSLSTNCFYAVAVWMKGLGYDSLLNYYYGAHKGKYEIYLPKNIVKASNGRFKLKYDG